MNSFFHKSIAICMAFVVCFTTMSFSVDMHYCGDKMVDYSFFHNVENCGMEKASLVSTCKNPEISKKSCCSDKQIVFEGQDDLKDTFDSLTFDQQVFAASFTYSYSSLFEGIPPREIPYKEYPPPYVKQDVQVLHQTFLI